MSDFARTARGTFAVAVTPEPPQLDGSVGRARLDKTWRGDLDATGAGLMLSAGDPDVGEAGYVAVETVSGVLDGRSGSFVLQQLGVMSAGEQVLTYLVTPGSGTGELTGIAGILDLVIDADGTHRYELGYDLPPD